MSKEGEMKDIISLKELEQMVISGSYKEAIEIIDKITFLKEISNEERYAYLLWKSQIYNKISIFDQALKIACEVLGKAEQLDNLHLKLNALENKAEALYRVGRVDESFQVLEQFREMIKSLEKKTKDFMTQPVYHFNENESLEVIFKCLAEVHFRRVPVTKDGKVVGIVSRPDVLRCILSLSSESINT